MADLGLSGGFAAGAGAEGLDQLLKRLFVEQTEKRRAAQEQQRIDNETAYRNASLASADAERKAREQEMLDKRASMAANAMTPGVSTLDPNSPVAKLMGESVLAPTLEADKTLSSVNIGGTPGGLTATANPGKITGRLRFTGTPQGIAQQSQDAARQRFIAANPKLGDAIGMLDPDKAASTITEYVKEQGKTPETETVARQNPRTGTVETLQNGTWVPATGAVPKGTHFMTEPAPKDTSATDANRAQQSYQYHSTELGKIRAPVDAQAQKLSDLNDELSQGTPQADSLVAPKLLSTLVGGQGSNIRINEAEISRVIGGRSKWQDFKAAMQKWSLDPASANSLTIEQRQQIHALVDAAAKKNAAQLAALDKAGDDLAGSNDPMQHRAILNTARKSLSGIVTGGGASATNAAPSASGGESIEHRVWRVRGKQGPEPK